jgi:pimeloyl-ACP methyl ester carboxylesterase
MVSFHHGTISKNADAPSMQSSTESLALFAALASAGFIAVVPDYIGYGSSAAILHPYYVEEYMSSACIDNLKAAQELAGSKNLDFNEELFLTGYSEGGYATMAVHKNIEKNGLDGFNLIASFPAAGGYDVKAMQEYVFSLDYYDEPSFLAFVSLAYQEQYNWSEPLTMLFNNPYAAVIPDLFNGAYSLDEIDAALTDDLSDLINNDCLTGADTNPDYLYFVNALEANSITDWFPTVNMFMYHGDADTTVPIENSASVYEQFIINGANSNSVELIVLSGATHGSGVVPFIEDMVPRLLSLSSVSN